MSKPININFLNGIRKDIALSLTDNKNQTCLNGRAASVFTAIDGAVTRLLCTRSLKFADIFQTLYNIADSVKDFFQNNYLKMVNFCKNLANKIMNTFNSFGNHSGGRKDIVSAAEGYVGKVNNRKAGNTLFSEGRDEAWCADTVTFIVKDVAGNRLPYDFGSPAVSNIRAWGMKHNAYRETSTLTAANRSDYILKNVKPGDIMIEKRNGKSHTGIVTRVYQKNGEVWFDTIEGNAGFGAKDKKDYKLGKKSYPATSATLSGFVKLDQWLK